jgi:2Fe-2S ferredoxin
MTTINYAAPYGTRVALDLPDGASVMQGAVMHGVGGIVGECGGNAICATCHVFVAEEDLDRLASIDDLEDEMLDMTAVPRRGTSRLSCVTPELDGLTVRTPDTQY